MADRAALPQLAAAAMLRYRTVRSCSLALVLNMVFHKVTCPSNKCNI
jgi:hypothetical protein